MPRKKKSRDMYIVVPARIQDLNTVHQMHNDCFPDKPRSLRWFMEKLSAEDNTWICYAAKIAGTDTVVGYILARLTAKHAGEIIALGVAPMYRRQGIGRLILAYFLDEADDVVGQVHTYVPDCSDYLAAQLFFRECGFPDSRIDRKKDAIKFQRSSV